jgi:hypothetical protein
MKVLGKEKISLVMQKLPKAVTARIKQSYDPEEVQNSLEGYLREMVADAIGEIAYKCEVGKDGNWEEFLDTHPFLDEKTMEIIEQTMRSLGWDEELESWR